MCGDSPKRLKRLHDLFALNYGLIEGRLLQVWGPNPLARAGWTDVLRETFRWLCDGLPQMRGDVSLLENAQDVGEWLSGVELTGSSLRRQARLEASGSVSGSDREWLQAVQAIENQANADEIAAFEAAARKPRAGAVRAVGAADVLWMVHDRERWTKARG